jgi:hypothetical protein
VYTRFPEKAGTLARAGDVMTITTRRKLLTSAWAKVVDDAEAAIRRFHADRKASNGCQVVFFEIAGDRHLHVNVIHTHRTAAETGWAGPARIPDGFVHNRTFLDVRADGIVRHIRNVVFTAEV